MSTISLRALSATLPIVRMPSRSVIRTIERCVALVLTIGLFGRIMSFPLNHDEQIHVVAARFFLQEPLYGSLGYNHLPGLPFLLSSFYAVTGSEHYLQAGRFLIFLGWLATAIIVWTIARHHTGRPRVGTVAMLVFAAGTLLGPPGMLVTNNFLPIPFALLGVHLFIVTLDQGAGRRLPLFVAGVLIGFAIILKISYLFLLPPIAIAAFMVPNDISSAVRLRSILLPLVAGGVIGALPALIVLVSDPVGLFTHTVRYFTEAHLAYWENSAAPKAMSVPMKMAVAESVWLGGGGVLIALLIAIATLTLRGNMAALRWWPLPFVAALAACGAAGAFAPTPAFPQYYEPPVPFVILLFMLIYRQLDASRRGIMQPVLNATALVAILMIVPRIAPGLPVVLSPSQWTGNAIHTQGRQIRAQMTADLAGGKVATLSPIVAVEGGLPIYREFAAGPFLYRVAEYLPTADRAYFATTSPADLARFLDNDPPAAIITGREAEFDPAFVEYARARGYRQVETGDPKTALYIRTATSVMRLESRCPAFLMAPSCVPVLCPAGSAEGLMLSSLTRLDWRGRRSDWPAA